MIIFAFSHTEWGACVFLVQVGLVFRRHIQGKRVYKNLGLHDMGMEYHIQNKT